VEARLTWQASTPEGIERMPRRQSEARGPTIAIVVPAIISILAVLTGTATGEGSQAGDPFAFLRPSIQVSPSERRTIDGGGVLVRILPVQGREVAVFAAGTLEASEDTLIRRVRDIVDLKKSSYVPAIARFSDPPDITDLAGLTLDEVDLRGIRDCQPANCDLKLGATEIKRLRAVIAAKGDSWKPAVTEEFRHLVLARVNAYLAGGHRSMSDYQARRDPVNLASTFATLLRRSAFLPARAADLAAHLEHYPTVPLPGAESFLYWSKEKFARKPVISVTHVTIVRGNGRSQFPEVVIASKQVFATHYTNGSLAVTMLLSAPPGSSPGYLVYVNRSAVDVVGGYLGIRRALIEGRVKSETERLFAIQRDRIDGHPRPSVSDR
jgi:hypothetical protein